MPIREEARVLPILTELSACLCTELEAAGFTMCFCGLMPGGEVPLDYCGGDCDVDGCGGQAWVRVVSIFPSTNFPELADAATCATRRAMVVEVGHAMCAPQPDNDGTPPGVQAQYDATFQQMASMDAMWRAIACCFGANQDRDYVLGEYAAIPAGGGCLAAIWNVTVEV